MVRLTDRPAMTIAVDFGRKAKKKQRNILYIKYGDRARLRPKIISLDK